MPDSALEVVLSSGSRNVEVEVTGVEYVVGDPNSMLQ